MSDILEDLQGKMKLAMKERDAIALNTFRALKTAFTNASIEKGHLNAALEESEQMAIVRKQIKQRQDSAEQFEKAGRSELQAKEEQEIKILEQFLPAAMSEEKVKEILEAVISETGATSKKDMGRVMKAMQDATKGCADGKMLAQIVGARLS